MPNTRSGDWTGAYQPSHSLSGWAPNSFMTQNIVIQTKIDFLWPVKQYSFTMTSHNECKDGKCLRNHTTALPLFGLGLLRVCYLVTFAGDTKEQFYTRRMYAVSTI